MNLTPRPRPRIIACHLLLPLLLASLAKATTVIPPTFEQLTARAELIFQGTVSDTHCEWQTAGTNRVIFTLVDFKIDDLLKGKAANAITLKFLGGSIGEKRLTVSGVPQFKSGEQVLLFVENNGKQFCPIVGVFHGKFGVHPNPGGSAPLVLMHNGKPLADVAQIGNGEGAEFKANKAKAALANATEAITLNDFKSKIREQVQQGGVK